MVLRTSDQTLTFLHNLIPAWLTDKNKASRKLFIDKKIAGEYLRNIFVEILSSVVNEPQPTCPSIDVDLEKYVSLVAVRVLCQHSETHSLSVVFSCLTSYQFIERRMLTGRIEIYHLLEDLRLAARLSFEEVKKQEILQEILNALESDVLVLSECPHLLHTCIRNTSKIVQDAVSIPQVSVPWLEWNVYAFPNSKISGMRCFATSPDKKTVAGASRQSILFFDAFTVETVSGPFEVSNDIIDDINQLEFSPDGKFIFLGRLDKWFSVERGCIEDFAQFSGNSHVYRWGMLTRDGKFIVVKRTFLHNPGICQVKSCVLNFLALWALKEIEEIGNDEMSVVFCPQVLCHVPGVLIKRLFEYLEMGKYLEQTGETLVSYNPSCHYYSRLKELTDLSQESSLLTVRQLVIELYPCIFNYQVWDLQTGMPVLQQVFSQGVQLNSFSYFCHVPCAYSECGLMMGCSGIEKAMSVCNIAVVTVLCFTLLGREQERELERE